MRNKRPRATFADLPEGVVGDILSRLSVRHLLRLKCVCKWWCNLISSGWFISMQLNRSISDPTCHYLLLMSKLEFPSNIFCTIRSPNIRVNMDEFKKLGPTSIVVGSINGLVCIACLGLRRSCFLWNPSIRQRRSLPKSSIFAGDKKRVQVTFGFGHEPDSDDYKVVRVLNLSADKGMPSTRVEVYSLNLDAWKEVKVDFPLNITRKSCDVTLNGFTYWLLKKENGNEKPFVVSFDMRREVFQQIAVPDVVTLESEYYSAVNFRGRLGLLVYGSQLELNKCLQVWMLEDERSGVGIWNKNFKFMMDFQISHHWGLTNGYIIVQNTPNVPFLYDPERKERKIIGIKQLDGVLYYVESLVSIKKLRRSRKSGIKKLK